jgi:predicted secreted hydrolase
MKSRLIALLALLTIGSPLPVLAQWRAAVPGYHYNFPRDHFNHPEFQTEWWYYTGNLRAADGHRFGFELTFFRQGVERNAPQENMWSVRDLYLAHLALTDARGRKFYHFERLNRSGPGLAGVDAKSERIWNGNWQVRLTSGGQQLQAVSDEFSLRLDMNSPKPPVIHGKNGVSQKSEGAGKASHYVSFTRLLTRGTIELNGKQYAVEGSSWMDHEFFSSSMAEDEVGWDWLALQLADNSELMLYRLRRRDGSVEPYSSGTYVDAQGNGTFLALSDFTMQPAGANWKSPNTHATYPTAWHVTVPRYGLALDITTPVQAQELESRSKAGPSYWEGAIDILGTRSNSPIRGVGYLEMTGYAANLRLSP